MSRLIPPQFDTYGRTFWIPSQVEPTVALIGTSLPAIRQSVLILTPRVSKVWSSYARFSILRSKHASGVETISGAGSTAPKSGPHKYQHMDSELALPKDSYEFDDRGKR